MATNFYEIYMDEMKKQGSGDAIDAALERVKKPGDENGVDDVIKTLPKDKRDDFLARLRQEKTASRPMASTILNSVKPIMAVAYNPQDQRSVLFIKRLDRALTDASGLERLKVVVLNPIMDVNVISKLEMEAPGAAIFKSGKKIGEMGGASSAMDMLKYLGENKSKFLS